jgi:anti-anti-sigma regulatory factor
MQMLLRIGVDGTLLAVGLENRDGMTMLRITARRGNGTERLLVEGRLAGEYVRELQSAAAAAMAEGVALALDLSGLTFVDAEGVRVLRALRARNARLTGCSSFVAQLLERP